MTMVFSDYLTQLLDIRDRQIFMKEGVTGTFYVQFYNVPKRISDGAERENNRLMLTVEQVRGKSTVKVDLVVRGPAFGTAFKLRSKTGEPEAIAKYVAAFLNRAAKEEPRLHAR